MYLKRFTTEFGDPITPSFIICRNDRFEKYRSAEALAAFRDAIAISCISRGWALALKYGNNHNVRYSNCFSFYPWLVDHNYKGLVMQSMAQIGSHEVRKLKGQSFLRMVCGGARCGNAIKPDREQSGHRNRALGPERSALGSAMTDCQVITISGAYSACGRLISPSGRRASAYARQAAPGSVRHPNPQGYG